MLVREELQQILEAEPAIVGMGNYLRNDDAVGLHIVDTLIEQVKIKIPIINVEDIIESYAFSIASFECDNIIIIDAVDMGSEAGTILFGKLTEMDELSNDFSTHKLSLILSEKIFKQSGKETYLLGIEAESIDFGEGLCEAVQKTADILIEYITTELNSKMKEKLYGN